MAIQKFNVNQNTISILLSKIEAGEIAIPEIQRPFVWDASKVRDLIDSLYRGYPIGYIITWKNPDVRIKGGGTSFGKNIIIDGQQRITALMAALLGKEIITKDYEKRIIKISFNPMEEKFEVYNPAIGKNPQWIEDISKLMEPGFNTLNFINSYCEKNKADINHVFEKVMNLTSIQNVPIGIIDLSSTLDIETVTEIFIRINNQGVVLSQADFAMSKIAANEEYGGNILRKCIDYFCHTSVNPQFFEKIKEIDSDFVSSEYYNKMSWLRKENDDLYDPSYTDMLRVSFTSEFKRGKLEDLVALLSGRNFETRTYEDVIAKESYEKLKKGILNFINENNFKNFIMIIRSAGFVEPNMIRSSNTLNFAYIVYLHLRYKGIEHSMIQKLVRRWFVMSILTGRYSSSPESQFDLDIRRINELGVEKYLEDIELGSLSSAFWEVALPTSLETSVASSPYFKVFLAAQIKSNDRGFLSRDITVQDLITTKGDVHHLFPKSYLKKNGIPKGKYNQIANYVMMQSEINISIKDRAPSTYFTELLEQANNGQTKYGAIDNMEDMMENFKTHCIPMGVENMNIEHYDEFLDKRRKLMALKIRDYFVKL